MNAAAKVLLVLLGLLGVVALVAVLTAVFAGGPFGGGPMMGPGGMMDGWGWWGPGGMMGGWGFFGVLAGLVPLLFWGGLIALAVWAVTRIDPSRSRGGATSDEASAEEILARRFARGEIGAEEYEDGLRVLRGPHGREVHR